MTERLKEAPVISWKNDFFIKDCNKQLEKAT
jgi:hypothetical protein